MDSVDLEQLECKPLRTDEVTKKVPDGAGGLVEIKSRMPVWIQEEYPDSAGRNMYEAFELSNDII